MFGLVKAEGLGDLTTALTSSIATALPVIIGVIGAIVGVVFAVAIGRYIFAKVRGSVR